MSRDTGSNENRGSWQSTLGFILAASGSAIGLGNIVKFSASAYESGGGAFYIPYLVALFVVGIPVMVLEFGLGQRTQLAFPEALGQLTGRFGEFVGWWALCNALIITMYYITLLAWVMGMMLGALGPLWEPSTMMPGYAMESLPNPVGYFFNLLGSPWVLIFVAIVWGLNLLICSKGPETIEKTVKFFVPAMWLTMVALIIRGLTLPGGTQGVLYLFTPDFSIMRDLGVWRGAFAQIFFSLSLGFGLLTAYASYLPRKSDVTEFAMQTSLLNCAFEYIAGFAIFSMLFAFSIVPKASTLSMSFFVVPEGIGQMPVGVKTFGVLFFGLLLIAGLSSSVSLIEGITAAILDKFGGKRWKVLAGVFLVGVLGSGAFAIPKIIDPGLNGNGTIGLFLLDFFDHWALEYGLLLVGLFECVLVGWVYGIERWFSENPSPGKATRVLQAFLVFTLRYAAPLFLGILLVSGLWNEVQNGLYGLNVVAQDSIEGGTWAWLAKQAPALWMAFTILGAWLLTRGKARRIPAGGSV